MPMHCQGNRVHFCQVAHMWAQQLYVKIYIFIFESKHTFAYSFNN